MRNPRPQDFSTTPPKPKRLPEDVNIAGIIPLQRKITLVAENISASNHDTVIPRHQDAEVSRYHDTTIEYIRKALREIGKEAATHRFTLAEKRAIANIIYTLNMQGVKTSENEIARIAINYIIEDFRQRNESSLLARALQALKR